MRYLLILLACLLSWSAVAQESCAPYDQVAAKLAAEFHETRVQQGIVGEGRALLAIFASPNGETWTAVMVRPDGLACMAAAGQDWQTRSDPAPEAEEGL